MQLAPVIRSRRKESSARGASARLLHTSWSLSNALDAYRQNELVMSAEPSGLRRGRGYRQLLATRRVAHRFTVDYAS